MRMRLGVVVFAWVWASLAFAQLPDKWSSEAIQSGNAQFLDVSRQMKSPFLSDITMANENKKIPFISAFTAAFTPPQKSPKTRRNYSSYLQKMRAYYQFNPPFERVRYVPVYIPVAVYYPVPYYATVNVNRFFVNKLTMSQ